MSATVAPTFIEMALDRLKTKTKQRRVPRDPKWDGAKFFSVTSVLYGAAMTCVDMSNLAATPDYLAGACVLFNLAATAGSAQNCFQTFKAAHESAFLQFTDCKPKDSMLNPIQSIAKSHLCNSFNTGALAFSILINGGLLGTPAASVLSYFSYKSARDYLRFRGPKGPDKPSGSS